jgi:hypothetical protein
MLSVPNTLNQPSNPKLINWQSGSITRTREVPKTKGANEDQLEESIGKLKLIFLVYGY